MEPASIIAIITAAIPFVTAAAKKILKTDTWGERKRGWNALLPIVIGIASAGVYAHSQGHDWVTSLAIGLGSGGVASSVRDIDKNLTNLVGALLSFFKGPQDNKPA
ncbi:MAG: hypothetical protein KCHDKBKB_02225 [Elusimicrobia bacterium]|nr:hypothetical protein [Elusimicrobiota bacterium]